MTEVHLNLEIIAYDPFMYNDPSQVQCIKYQMEEFIST